MSTVPPILLFPGGRQSAPPEPAPAVITLPIIDIRGKLPVREGARPYYLRVYTQDPDAPTAAERAASLALIRGVTYHYTASNISHTPRSIAQYQIGPEPQDPFPAIAYVFVVGGSGVVYLCHDLETRSWHSGARVDGVARNQSHVGAAWIGDYEPSTAQLLGLAVATVYSERRLGRELPAEGHQDAYPNGAEATPCPGPTWPAWRPAVAAMVQVIRDPRYRFVLTRLE